MLSKIRHTADGARRCEFLWLNAEASGPVDPSCGSDAQVVLMDSGGEEEPRCFHHAAHEIAEAICTELGFSVRWPQPTFRSFVGFLEPFIAGVIVRKEDEPAAS